MDVIRMVFDVGMVVKPLRSPVDIVKGVADGPIFAKVAFEAPNVEAIDDPREAGALAKCAVKAAWAASLSWVGRRT